MKLFLSSCLEWRAELEWTDCLSAGPVQAVQGSGFGRSARLADCCHLNKYIIFKVRWKVYYLLLSNVKNNEKV